jgi:single-strand DNA-binding protein
MEKMARCEIPKKEKDMGFNYNHTTLVGRVVKDPELKEISENTSRLPFTLAVSRNYRKDDGSKEADFIPVVLWGKLAEVGFQLLKKGSPVLIWGKLQVRNYEKDSEKKWMTEVIAENFQILDKLPAKASA